MTGKLLDEGMKIIEKILEESGYSFSSFSRSNAIIFLDTGNYDVSGMNQFLNDVYGVENYSLAKKLSSELFKLIRKHNGVE